MNILDILAYGGIAVLVILLVIFELKDRNTASCSTDKAYEYYTADGSSVRIRHVFGSLYKIYTFGSCPVPTKHDRVGCYFTVRARSASDAENKVDNLYRH